MMNENSCKLPLCLSIIFIITGCQLTDSNQVDKEVTNNISQASVEKSYLSGENPISDSQKANIAKNNKVVTKRERTTFTPLNSIEVDDVQLGVVKDFKSTFDNNNKNIEMVSDGLNLSDFIHYVLGDLLKLDYVLDDKAAADTFTVSLSIKGGMTQLQTFNIVEDLLEQHDYTLLSKNDVLYIVAKTDAGQTNDFSYGIGKNAADVPNAGQNVFQLVPLLYSQASDFSLILRSLANVDVSQSRTQNVLYLQGKKENIKKALEFIRLIDKPSNLAANVGLIELVYSAADDFAEQLKLILKNEGINVGIGQQNNDSAVLVPVTSKGSIIVFAKTAAILARINFWAQKLDKSDDKGEFSYFIYRPEFARASDLGESLSSILNVSGSKSSQNANETSTSSANKATQGTNKRASSNNMQSGINVAVDERSNTLIISGTSKEYQKILPLIKSLDILPKQIMLEMTLAEVTLKDDFKQGVEFAYGETNGNNNYALGTKGALGLAAVGGFSYSLTGINGSVQLALSQDNSLVNILSRPSIVVRDGVTASITVGTDIPVVGATTIDPISGSRETTSIDYRKTGIELEVTPTVNSQGVVIMEISQKISNTVDSGAATGGSPSIFERSIKTEVVASSGQTIILGGLISENKSTSNSKVPFFGDLPLIGALFRVEGDVKDKTELVVLVTPRIIQREDEWKSLKNQFFNALDNIELQSDTSLEKNK